MEESRDRTLAQTAAVRMALRTLVLSDLVGSTALVEELGDARAAQLFRHHDRAARDLLEQYGGLEIDKTDGFLLLFERPWQAVRYGLAYHRALEELSRAEEVELAARVGIHLGEVILHQNTPEHVARGAKPLEVEGLAKPTAARLMSLARGRQTLLTRGAFDLARRGAVDDAAGAEDLSWLAHGGYLFKGVAEPIDVFEVGETGKAPLAAPESTAKVKRALGGGEILGWRPAPGLTIPQRPHWVVERKLGEGGFGEVWLAEHEKTQDRRVFKFCYEASRLSGLQREITLFRLLKEELGERDDIARIFDWSFDQAPYFIEAEHTAGGDLTQWAEEQGGLGSVPPEVRLELGAQVATALAAAHSVGVIHKDVKPSNILITTDAEGRPRARLTDFGIGAVLEPKRLAEAGITVLGLTEETMPTAATYSGTRMYMAPEVVEGQRATIQSDIYALGVLLYQMVVGDLKHSLAPGWRRDVADELLCEDIAITVDGSPERRLSNGLRLAERLRSLEGRRLEYKEAKRARKALARSQKRRKVAAVATAVLAIIAAVATFQGLRIAREAERADREAAAAREVSEFLVGIFRQSDPDEALGNTITAREILDKGAERLDRELADQPATRARLQSTVGEVYVSLGLYDTAAPLIESALATRRDLYDGEHLEVAESLNSHAELLSSQGDYASAEPLYRESLAMRRKLLGDEHPDVAESLNDLATLLWTRGEHSSAEPLYRESLAMRRKLLGNEHPDVATSLTGLAAVLWAREDYPAAELLLRESLAMRRKLLGDQHPDVAESLNNLAAMLWTRGEYASAEPLYRESLAMRRKLLGNEHPHVAVSLNNLAFLLKSQGDYASAEPLYRESLAMQRKLLGDEHPDVATSLNNLALLLESQGDYAAAEPLYRESLAMRRKLLGEHPLVATSLKNLARLLTAQGDPEAGEHNILEALRIFRATLPAGHWRTVNAESVHGGCLTGLGRYAEAEPLLLDAYPILKEQKGTDAGYTRDALRRIVDLYEAWGKPEKVGEYRALMADP